MIQNLRQQLSSFWSRQNTSQKVTLVVLVLAVVVVAPLLVSWATTPSYAVAFSGLSEADAGQIVQALDDANIPYKLSGSGTIQVPSNQVYSVRLRMAKDGLPQSGTVGFELFSQNTLGMNEFTQRVNYQRALEGELERTIGSLDTIEAVRVHVVTPEKSLLSEAQAPTTASVTLKVKPGRALDASVVASITHLVASAVEGLQPENVVIVDTNGNMLAAGDSSSANGAAIAQVDNQRAIELAAAAEVQKKAQSLLDSVLGPNRAVVQASVAMDWTQREITSQSFEPTVSAIRSSQKTNEIYTTNGETTGGVPGSASNLPTPVATVPAGAGSSNYQHTEETVNYEISQTETKEIAAPGQIKRISLSVMVDGVTDQQQLDALKESVAAAAGIDTQRGDSLSVQTLPFDRSYYTQQAAEIEKSAKTGRYLQIGEAIAAALAAGLLLFFVLGQIKKLRQVSAQSWKPVMLPAAEAARGLPGGAPQQIAAGAMAGAKPGALAGAPSLAQTPAPRPAEFKLAQPDPQDEQMQRVVSRMTEENPASVAEIIQLWLAEDKK